MPKILVIDDEPILLEAMRKALTRASHEVTAISDPRIVLRGDVGSEFDLVVSDMVMPAADGLETLFCLRKLNPNIRTIAISGGGKLFGATYSLELASKLGADRILAKPFELKTLVDTVDWLLTHKDPAAAPNPRVSVPTQRPRRGEADPTADKTEGPAGV